MIGLVLGKSGLIAVWWRARPESVGPFSVSSWRVWRLDAQPVRELPVLGHAVSRSTSVTRSRINGLARRDPVALVVAGLLRDLGQRRCLSLLGVAVVAAEYWDDSGSSRCRQSGVPGVILLLVVTQAFSPMPWHLSAVVVSLKPVLSPEVRIFPFVRLFECLQSSRAGYRFCAFCCSFVWGSPRSRAARTGDNTPGPRTFPSWGCSLLRRSTMIEVRFYCGLRCDLCSKLSFAARRPRDLAGGPISG